MVFLFLVYQASKSKPMQDGGADLNVKKKSMRGSQASNFLHR